MIETIDGRIDAAISTAELLRRTRTFGIGLITRPQVEWSFALSLVHTLSNPEEFAPWEIGGVLDVPGDYHLDVLRNLLTQMFLEKTDLEWLLSVDTDMTWRPEHVRAVLAHADAKHRPVVGGLAYKLEMNPTNLSLDEYQRHPPTPALFKFKDVKGPAIEWESLIPDGSGLVQVDGTGAAFTLIHRGVFERIGAPWWYSGLQLNNDGGKSFGYIYEDVGFCWKCKQAGIPIHVDTNVRIGHTKRVVI